MYCPRLRLTPGGARSRLCSSVCHLAALLTTVAALACGGSTDARINPGSSLTISTSALPTLDAAREGQYFLWFIDAAGRAHSAGPLTPGSAVTVSSPIADPARAIVTVERSSNPASPSKQVLLTGELNGGAAAFSVVGAITQGIPLRERPGQFTMFTPSDNDVYGYPSHEESGVWLFNIRASETEQNDFYVRLAQLQAGWIYEGWMVRDYGTPGEIWLSYGKFLPDWAGAVNAPDDTGWGPFSGVTDYTNSRLEDFPGDDWISNPLHLPFPAALTLPLNLREKDGTGRLRWTHVITIEPSADKGEPIGSERPFFLRLYVDSFGDLNPGMPRTITMRHEAVPTATLGIR